MLLDTCFGPPDLKESGMVFPIPSRFAALAHPFLSIGQFPQYRTRSTSQVCLLTV